MKRTVTVSNCWESGGLRIYLSSGEWFYSPSANAYGLAGPAQTSAADHFCNVEVITESQNILRLHNRRTLHKTCINIYASASHSRPIRKRHGICGIRIISPHTPQISYSSNIITVSFSMQWRYCSTVDRTQLLQSSSPFNPQLYPHVMDFVFSAASPDQ
jgi:hypothetical protein